MIAGIDPTLFVEVNYAWVDHFATACAAGAVWLFNWAIRRTIARSRVLTPRS